MARSQPVLSRIAVPAVVFAGVVALLVRAGPEARRIEAAVLGGAPEGTPYALATVAWLAGGWLAARLVKVLVWEQALGRGARVAVPRLLQQMTTALISAAALGGMLATVYGQSPTGLLATSGALGIVVAFALRSLILDVFSGIAMNLDGSFGVGDWVEVTLRGMRPFTGIIREINWRTTVLEASNGSRYVLPNSELSLGLVQTFTRPDPHCEYEATLRLDFHVPTARAVAVLDNALRAAAAAGDVLAAPAPKVRIAAVGAHGVEYALKFWIDPRPTGPGKARHAVMRAAVDHLVHAGLSPAYDKLDAFSARMPDRNLSWKNAAHAAAILERTEILASLQREEIERLAAAAVPRLLHRGEEVVTAGAPGETMHVVVEGMLEVELPAGPDGGSPGRPLRVGLLLPGEFFGEMSLLTGAPRSATVRAAADSVTYEIGREQFAALLEARPSIAEEIADVVAAREVRNALAMWPADEARAEMAKQGAAEQIVEGIRRFFSRAFAA